MKINGYRDIKRNVRVGYTKILSIIGLSILSFLFLIVAFTQNAAAVDCSTCHSTYANEIAPTYHGGASQCIFCHTGYASDPWAHSGTTITETKCRTCHVEGTNLNESHGNHYYGPNKADCTQCHFANTTQAFELDPSLYKHSHNLTVEYNYYNYSLYGMPLSTNGGAGKGMFPYYTCTLTCHNGSGGGQPSIEDEVIGWNQSAHANSRHGDSTYDSKNSCAKCKSPPNFNGNASDTTAIAQADWQGIQCRVCHNLHNDTYGDNDSTPIYYAYYNSTLSAGGPPVYEKVSNTTELCEKCHLTFTDDINSTHNSNFGGYHKETAGLDCADCHMNSTYSNLTHKFEVKNTTSEVTGCEVCHDYTNSHTNFAQRSNHDDKVDCVACHDQTFTTNASGYALYVFPNKSTYSYGLWKASGVWTTYFNKTTSIKSWPLHNITRSVTCEKCHNATSAINGTIAVALVCSNCHASYSSAVNSSGHNRTLNASAPDCTGCHLGYLPSYGHTTGNRSYIVNESNTCRNSGCHEQNVSGFFERHSSSSDCTQCHFANTTQLFSLNTSLYTHDHNLTIEHNFYEYNTLGMPIRTNGGAGVGMFPYYTCTLTCHKYNATTGVEGKIDVAAESWLESAHAQSLHMSGDNKMSCAKCKSPANYNVSANQSSTIAQADWQGIQCRVCHNLHDRRFPNYTGPSGFPVAFYNSTNSSLAGYAVYEQVPNATVLCEKCHLTFTDDINSTHNSNYGGYHKQTVGFNCTNCHMNSTFSDEMHKFEVKNTTSGVTGCEVCHDYAGSHSSFSQRSYHDNKVDCVACHDQTFTTNASGYAEYVFPYKSAYSYGLWNVSGNWTTYFKKSSTSIKSWPLHNITGSVTCSKCHNATSALNGTIAPALACSGCHTSYGSAVSSSKHNQTLYPGAPACTGCHAGYEPNYGHTTGAKGYIVNESNTCRSCHVQNVNLNESHGNRNYGQNYTDCTKCHFANTTQQFSLNTSLYTHDHNLTVEYNFYNYNLSGIPLSTNGGAGKGMFPYYTCTLTCHNGSGGGQPSIEDEVIGWNLSAHARSRHGDATYDSNAYCARCKSPPNYNLSAASGNRSSYPIAEQDWQGIQCKICHNLHNDTYSGNGTTPINISFYNTTATLKTDSVVYDQVSNSTELCQKCHSNRNFAGRHKDTVGFDCADCHANRTLSNYNHTFEVKNTTSGVTGCEVCHTYPGTAHSLISNYHGNITCWACHDQTVVDRNATNYSISGIFGIYKDTSTNKWTTYKSGSSWVLHNISKNVTCTKCHGARSLYTAGGIASGFGSDLTYTSHSTDSLVSGYNLIAIRLLPDPAISAKNLLYPSSGGIPGVTKVMKWNSASQSWESYVYDGSTYVGTNFTLDGYKGYFLMGNASTAGQTFTFSGIR
ncbi:hypothetical protein [Candidatus Methanoperedens nitratireducens]|uniref:Uncharacterized protein n=1 Tax=Candidatus Methanoperedens nitratireducens TaxID=1392998 RepID=A0A284VSZ1_9EURY|nr:hypothetical protein [Candidatus Methanoperedens nitroreducens]SNQ62303.1 exported hypothetical protein [Candidatus Methanoperedens nitroreducens]